MVIVSYSFDLNTLCLVRYDDERGTVENEGKCTDQRSICLADPHFQESIRKAVGLCAFQVLVGQKLFLQQSVYRILDGTG